MISFWVTGTLELEEAVWDGGGEVWSCEVEVMFGSVESRGWDMQRYEGKR